MPWFAAHAISIVKAMEGQPITPIPVWENVLLVEADSIEEAWLRAENIAKENYQSCPSDEYTCDGRPASMEFIGIRKLVSGKYCDPETEGRPRDGSEVTYSQFQLDEMGDLQKLMHGLPVRLLLDDTCGE